MSTKKKIYLVFVWLCFFASIWAYIFFSVVWSWEDLTADVSNSDNWNDDIINENWESGQKNSETPNNENDSKQLSGKLNIHIPKFLKNQWLSVIKRQIENENKDTQINYVVYDDFRKYKEKIFDWWDEMDIFLISDIWIKDFKDKIYPFQFADAWIKSIFHSQFYNILENEDYSFIPYWIDPLIVLTQQNSYWNNINQLQYDHIKRYIMLNSSDRLSTNFWLDLDTFQALDRWVYVHKNYKDLLLQILQIIGLSQDWELFEFVRDIAKDGVYKWWSINNFIRMVRQNSCRENYSLCLFAKWQIQIFFGYLSDMDLLEKSFDDKLDYKIYNSPFFDSDYYPVRLRGLVINSDIENENLAFEFISKYIDLWTSWSRFLENYTLSAFNQIYSQQINKEIYDKIRPFQWRFSNFVWSDKYLENVFKESNMKDVLEWNFSQDRFIEELPNVFQDL